MKRLFWLFLPALLLCGCITNPISDYLAKHRQEEQIQLTQTVTAAVQPLINTNQALIASAKNAADNQAKIDAQNKIRYDAIHEDVTGTGEALADNNITVATLLNSYAEQGFDPLTDAQKTLITNIVKGLESKETADNAAAQQKIDAINNQLKAAQTNIATLNTEKAQIAADRDSLAAKASNLGTQVKNEINKVNQFSSKYQQLLARHSWLKSTAIKIALWFAIPWIIVYVLLPIGSMFFPILVPISKLAQVFMGKILKIIFTPLHTFFDMLEKDIETKLTAAAAAATTAKTNITTATTTVKT